MVYYHHAPRALICFLGFRNPIKHKAQIFQILIVSSVVTGWSNCFVIGWIYSLCDWLTYIFCDWLDVCCLFTVVFLVIYQTRETVFHHISKHWEVSWKYDAQRSIFNEIRGVWKCDETLSRVFHISSQSKLKLRSKRRNKIIKIYAN